MASGGGVLPRQAPPLASPVAESEWTGPRDDCPHPGRWHSTDSDSTEIEVTDLVAGFVTALQPDLAVETGTAWGQTAEAIGAALQLNGQGRLVTFEPDPDRAGAATSRCSGLPVDVQVQSSLDGLQGLSAIGFAWLDSTFEVRCDELRLVADRLTPGGVVGVHDVGAKFPEFSGDLLATARSIGFDVLSLSTPRGVVFLS